MSTSKQTKAPQNREVVLSTLWIFVMFNYLYVDLVMMIINPDAYQKMAKKMTEEVVLGAGALMEVAIAMILLSRILPYRANRPANMVAGVVMTAFAAVTMLGGKQAPLFYRVFTTMEIICTLFIVWYAWTWPRPERHDLVAEHAISTSPILK